MVMIHGIELDFDPACVWVSDYLQQVSDVFALSGTSAPCSGTIQICSEKVRVGPGLRELEDGLFIGKDVLFDSRYGVRFEVPGPTTVRLTTDRPAFEWLIWCLQIVALHGRKTFVHGAALERDGQAILFPSWGGVGKTALAAQFVRHDGWRLLGDDFTFIDETGKVFGFPKAMVLYPYHRPLFPEVFNCGKGPIAPTGFNEVLSRAATTVKPILRKWPSLLSFARRHNPQSVRINPSMVFGQDRLAGTAQLQAVVWLERRQDIDRAIICDAKGSMVSRVVGSTINEFDPWCVRLTNVAMGLGILSYENYFDAWYEIASRGIRQHPQHILYLPTALPVEDVPAAVKTILEGSEILCGAVN